MATTLEAIQAEALFASYLQASQRPTADDVRETVASTLRRLGTRGCAGAVAAEFGAHPDTAVARMRWALTTVHDAFPTVETTTREPVGAAA
jgi:hypothetical protein